MLRCRIALLLLLVVLVMTGVDGQEIVSGFLDDKRPEDRYPAMLDTGQWITISARALSGDLDTVLELIAPDGKLVAENDDADDRTLDSVLSYQAMVGGKYVIVISNYTGSSGEYELEILISQDGDPIISSFADVPFLTGFVSDEITAEFVVTLAPDEAVIATAIGVSDLDTYLTLLDDSGQVVAENDDRTYWELDAEIVYTSKTGGEYTLVLRGYEGTEGDYRLSMSVVASSEAPIVLRMLFTGEPLTIDTEHFRIHYTLEGEDATTEAYAQEVARIMEDIWHIQIDQMGWPAPLPDGKTGGDDRLDVYIGEIINDEMGGDFGATSPEPPLVDDAATPDVIERASASYIVLDNDYDLAEEIAERVLRATAAHEFHHMIQFGYDAQEPMRWYAEATATWLETQTFVADEEATRYVPDLFLYPEVCFGVDGDTDPTGGLLMYGEWLFIQSLVDRYGHEVIQALWQNIARVDGWDALKHTLDAYDDTITAAMIRYHAQNLLRNYDLAPEFGDEGVWIESAIDDLGLWDFSGEGIQELAANYFLLELGSGTFDVRLVEAEPVHELWLIGVKDKSAQALPLGTGNTIIPGEYEHAYLMVFNHAIADDLAACTYTSYRLEVTQGTGTPPEPAFTLSTRHFLPPE